jgi:hypothetical protein
MKNSTYFSAQSVIDFYERLGKTATADYFRGIDERDCDIVRHGDITWIPATFVRYWVELSSASTLISNEVYDLIEYDVIQWIPITGEENPEEVARMHASIAAKNN